jgi:hypothetical protein
MALKSARYLHFLDSAAAEQRCKSVQLARAESRARG